MAYLHFMEYTVGMGPPEHKKVLDPAFIHTLSHLAWSFTRNSRPLVLLNLLAY
jgi:S-ribosylhomocysteine lyase LuxS involved in autoinducer biosynthesis